VETLLALFPEVDEASRAVSAIMAAGLLPAALEMVDQQAIKAVEASAYAAGLPTDIGGALVIELDAAGRAGCRSSSGGADLPGGGSDAGAAGGR
jgi:FAD/FMN-containing dehydrogenase